MILDILKEIEEAKGNKPKLSILKANKDNDVLQELWYFTYGRVNLHTRKTVPLEIGSDSFPKNFGAVVSLLDKLRCKVASGKAQEGLIYETLKVLHTDCIEVFNRVIKGNLRCGLGATVANKVWGKDFIKKYPVMLISAYCPKKAAKIMKGGAVLQLKSDGVRGICEASTVLEGGYSYRFYSRQGEEFLGLDEVFREDVKELIGNIYNLDSHGVRTDGEFTYIDENGKHDPSKASGIMNKAIQGTATKEELESLTYVVWDLYLPEEDEIYSVRLEDLKGAIEDINPEKIILAETWPVNNLEEVAIKYQEIVDAGNEGVVLKSMSNLWKDTRVSDCIKYKEKHQAEFVIKGHYLGEEGKEFQKVLGGFYIESQDGKVISKTGSGLTFYDRGILAGTLDLKGKPIYLKDDDGNYIKDPNVNYEDYHGQIVTIEYNKRTKTKDGRETFSLRFPIVKQFRLDKDIANTVEEMVDQENASRGFRL